MIVDQLFVNGFRSRVRDGALQHCPRCSAPYQAHYITDHTTMRCACAPRPQCCPRATVTKKPLARQPCPRQPPLASVCDVSIGYLQLSPLKAHRTSQPSDFSGPGAEMGYTYDAPSSQVLDASSIGTIPRFVNYRLTGSVGRRTVAGRGCKASKTRSVGANLMKEPRPATLKVPHA